MFVETQKGSATSARPTPASSDGDLPLRGVIIAHIVNSVGAWGRGFVLAVDELSPIPRGAYKEMARRYSKDILLGETQFCEVEPDVWVANMVAQNGIDKTVDPNGCLVDYKALNECLKTTFERAVLLGCNVHVPSGMGSGLAGGSKQMIHGIITNRAIGIDTLEKHMKFVPRVTMWEFDDITATSYVASTNTAFLAVGTSRSTPDPTIPCDGSKVTDDQLDIDTVLKDL